MSDATTEAILRRKIGEPGVKTETASMSPAKAFRLAVARAGQDSSDMEATLSGCREEKVEIEQIVEGLNEQQLIVLLEGPQRARGLALFDRQVIGGVIEHLTTGRVVPGEAIERPPTRTDAMMLSELLDRTLAAMEQELMQAPDAPPITGYRTIGILEGDRAVTMALEEVPYRSYRLAIDLGRGAKSGEIAVYFPLSPPRANNFGTKEFEEWNTAWRKNVQRMEAPVEAILHRVSMSVEDVTNLSVGSLIPVPRAMLAGFTLEGLNKNAVATAKLGQSGGYRAVRINSPISSSDATLPQAPVAATLLFPAPDPLGGAVVIPENAQLVPRTEPSQPSTTIVTAQPTAPATTPAIDIDLVG